MLRKEKSNWAPVAGLAPIVLALLLIAVLASVDVLPAWGLGLATAAIGVGFVGAMLALGVYMRRRTDRWRRTADRGDATHEEAIRGLIDDDVRGVLLTLFVPGLLIAGPVLIVLGLAYSAVSAL